MPNRTFQAQFWSYFVQNHLDSFGLLFYNVSFKLNSVSTNSRKHSSTCRPQAERQCSRGTPSLPSLEESERATPRGRILEVDHDSPAQQLWQSATNRLVWAFLRAPWWTTENDDDENRIIDENWSFSQRLIHVQLQDRWLGVRMAGSLVLTFCNWTSKSSILQG